MQSYDKQATLDFHKIGRPVTVIERKGSNTDISSNIEALVILTLLVCLVIGKVIFLWIFFTALFSDPKDCGQRKKDYISGKASSVDVQ